MSVDWVQIGPHRLACGDCREILPTISRAELIVTDPPWKLLSKRRVIEGNERALELWREVAPLLQASRLCLWLPTHADPREWLNPLGSWPYLRSLMIRRAIPGYFGRVLLDVEMVFVLGSWPDVRKGRMVVPGGLQITYNKSGRAQDHPAPRSQLACDWLVKWWSDEGDRVLDPFMGSGTTGVACERLGRKCIGIEIERKYFDSACKRIQAEVDQGKFEFNQAGALD